MTSKTRLGVIILALDILRKLGILFPRIVSRAAAQLEVSRKTGYESGREIREILAPQGAAAADADAKRRELTRLKIKVQILTFERDNPPVRFSERQQHLPPAARSLAVRLLRDFSGELSGTEIALTIGVPLPSLKRWDGKAAGDCQFPRKPDHRGEHRRASPEDVERVLKDHGELEKSMTLDQFTAHFGKLHPENKLDRKTITRILAEHGKRKIEPRKGKKPYHPTFEVYYPGAQIAFDATEVKVFFASEPDKPVKVKKEVAIDIASVAIVGDTLAREETAEGVEEVVVKARAECESLLALLSDNGSANRSGRIEEVAGKETEIGQIFTFPGHPQSDGHIEGLFGQFKRIVGKIEIDDSTKERLASSIAGIIWEIFIHFHNYSPRKRLGGLAPLEYVRRYMPTGAEVDAAREGLERRQARSRDLRRDHPRLSQPEFRELVERTVKRHRLEITLDEAMKALLSYDERVIQNASNAFFVATARDAFDERKRTFAYFMGIVRNKQKEIDAARVRHDIETQKTARLIVEQRAKKSQRQKEAAQEKEDLRNDPEPVILKYARMLLVGRMHCMKATFGAGLRAGLRSLHTIGRGTRATLERLADTIRRWGEFGETLKAEMVDMLFSEWEEITGLKSGDAS